MSYILDALRKSEQERAQGSVERLETAATTASQARRRTLVLVALLVVALVAVLGTLVWTLRDRIAGAPAADPEMSGAPDAASAGVDAAPSSPPVFDSTRIVEPRADPDETNAPVAALDEEPPSAAGSTPSTAGPVSIESLDASVRRTLPALTISVLSYSPAPERRFAMIDGRIVREGESISGNLTLLRIEKDRVVLENDGARFFLSP